MQTDNDFLEGQLKRIITKLFKNFLILAKDIEQDHLENLAKMSNKLTPDLLKELNFLDFTKASRIRKKILDDGNESIRETSDLLKNFTVTLKNDKK